MPNSANRSEVAQHLDLGQIRYSMVWEDHDLLAKGLDIKPTDHLLACSPLDVTTELSPAAY